MNEKQWVYVYNRIKKLLAGYKGEIPDDNMTTELLNLHADIMTIIAKSRSANNQIETDIQQVMGMVFKLIHSLEAEGKAV